MSAEILPASLHFALESALDTAVFSAAPVSGGDVNRAAKIETEQGAFFVKWKTNAPPGVFAAEADGLARLARATTLRVPNVIIFSDRESESPLLKASDDNSETPESSAGNKNNAVSSGSGDNNLAPSFLVLEWLEPKPPTDREAFTRSFAEGMAALHETDRAPDGKFGLDRDNYLGSQPQNNTPTASWPEFYRDRRLVPQIERARRLKRLNPQRERNLMRVVDDISRLLDDLPERAVLIHGDLWSGNFLRLGNQAALIDPAVYYAEREVELAFVELFGGFPSGFVAAYNAAFPLDKGYLRRRPLHQLYPLLIHLNHFGETYGPSVDQAISWF